jgi:hypothetical protein
VRAGPSLVWKATSCGYHEILLSIRIELNTSAWPVRTRQLPCYSIPAPPAALADHIPEDTYKKSQAYGRDKTRWALFKQVYNQTLNALYIGGGAYKWVWTLTGGWMAKMGFGGDRVVSRSVAMD